MQLQIFCYQKSNMYKQCIKLLLSIFLKCLELFSAMNRSGFRERELHVMPEINTGFTY